MPSAHVRKLRRSFLLRVAPVAQAFATAHLSGLAVAAASFVLPGLCRLQKRGLQKRGLQKQGLQKRGGAARRRRQ